MPPRSGQLDEISQAIGELKGLVSGIEKYVHEGRHGVNNLSQKVDAMRVGIGKDIAAVEAKIGVQIKAMEDRIGELERKEQQEAGARGVVTWFLQSPLIGWIAAAVLFFTAWWKGQIK